MGTLIEASEKRKTFWSITALAYALVAAVLFGILWVIVAAVGEPVFATPLLQFNTGAFPLFLGIAASFGLAIPIAFVIARAMMSSSEKSALGHPGATRLPREG